MSRSGEFEWIARYLAPLASQNSFGLQDDAALLAVDKAKDLVITQDAIFETVHFFANESPDAVARKALRVNVSDLIAKGATPKSYSLALGVPDKWSDSSMQLFAEGLADDQKRFSIELTGGDTFSSSERLSVAITMIGEIEPDNYVSRFGAKLGDIICTTGTIGDAAIGLWLKSGGAPGMAQVDAQWLIERHKIPRPPFGFQALVSRYATASMDISDGLLGDLVKLCSASNVAGLVNREQIPVSLAVTQLFDAGSADEAWLKILTGGDDYQVLFTMPPHEFGECQIAAREMGIAVTHIGEIVAGESGNVSLEDRGVPISMDVMSYSHF